MRLQFPTLGRPDQAPFPGLRRTLCSSALDRITAPIVKAFLLALLSIIGLVTAQAQDDGSLPFPVSLGGQAARGKERPYGMSYSAVTVPTIRAWASRPVRQRSGTPCAAASSAPTTTPRWQLSPPTFVFAMIPASKSPAYFQAR